MQYQQLIHDPCGANSSGKPTQFTILLRLVIILRPYMVLSMSKKKVFKRVTTHTNMCPSHTNSRRSPYDGMNNVQTLIRMYWYIWIRMYDVNNVQTLKIENGTSGPFENLLNQEGCVLCTAQCTVCSALTNYGMLTKCTCKKRNTGVTNYHVPENE